MLGRAAAAVLALGGAPLAAAPPGAPAPKSLAAQTAQAPSRGQLDTVETIAGPGFCEGDARFDPASTSVRALAVEPNGRMFFDAGPPASNKVAVVEPDGSARLLDALTLGQRPAVDPAAPAAGDPRPPSTAGRLVPDGDGGVLVAVGDRIIQVTAGGVSTIAGGRAANQPPGHGAGSGDGGPAAQASFARIMSMAGDDAGNLYIADRVDDRNATVHIRFFNRSPNPVILYPGTPDELTVAPGSIDVVAGAGSGTETAGPDASSPRPARRASVNGIPPALAVAGNRLYIAAHRPAGRGNRRGSTSVRMVNLAGEPVTAHGLTAAPAQMVTLADNPDGFRGDGGPARDARFSYVPGMAADANGNLYLADERNHRVRRIDSTGTVLTFAGARGPRGTDTRAGGFDGNDRPADRARLNRPYDVKVGPQGRVVISDSGNGQVRVVDATGTIRLARGHGIGHTWTCEGGQPPRRVAGQAIPLEPPGPAGLAVDRNGDIYALVADLGQVKKIGSDGIVTTAAGIGRTAPSCPGGTCPNGDGGPAPEARLTRPVAIAARPQGGFYVLETGYVRFVNTGASPVEVHGVHVAPGTIATVAGNGTQVFDPDGGKALETPVFGLTGALAADGKGHLFLADSRVFVRQIDPEGTMTTFVPRSQQIGVCCREVSWLTVDARDNLYVMDVLQAWVFNRGDRELTVHGQAIPPGEPRIVAGNGRPGFGGDGGPAVSAELEFPGGMTVDRSGNLYLAPQVSSNFNSIRKVDGPGTITTVAGSGPAAFNGDGLRGELTALRGPADVALDRCGNLLIADQGNDRVRRLNLVPACPAAATAPDRPAKGTQKESGQRGVPLWALIGAGLLAALVAGGLLAVRWRRVRARRR